MFVQLQGRRYQRNNTHACFFYYNASPECIVHQKCAFLIEVIKTSWKQQKRNNATSGILPTLICIVCEMRRKKMPLKTTT